MKLFVCLLAFCTHVNSILGKLLFKRIFSPRWAEIIFEYSSLYSDGMDVILFDSKEIQTDTESTVMTKMTACNVLLTNYQLRFCEEQSHFPAFLSIFSK